MGAPPSGLAQGLLYGGGITGIYALFVAFRKRKPWLVPTIFGVVIVPAFLVLLFVLVA